MIKIESQEWQTFVNQIEQIKTKSNRQVFCAKCWLILNYEQKIKHIKEIPEHESSILTSAKFATAQQILSLAQACKKIVTKPDGQYLISPFHGFSKHVTDTSDSGDFVEGNVAIQNPFGNNSSSGESAQSTDTHESLKIMNKRIDKLEHNMSTIQQQLLFFQDKLTTTQQLQQQIYDQVCKEKSQQDLNQPMTQQVNYSNLFNQNPMASQQNFMASLQSQNQVANPITQNQQNFQNNSSLPNFSSCKIFYLILIEGNNARPEMEEQKFNPFEQQNVLENSQAQEKGQGGLFDVIREFTYTTMRGDKEYLTLKKN